MCSGMPRSAAASCSYRRWRVVHADPTPRARSASISDHVAGRILAYAPGPVPCTGGASTQGRISTGTSCICSARYVAESIRRGSDSPHLLLPLRRVHLQVCPFVKRSKRGTFCGVGHHDKVIPGDVPSGRCLNGNFETRLDDRRVYRASTIQAFPHGTGRREQLVNSGENPWVHLLCIVPWALVVLGSGDLERRLAA